MNRALFPTSQHELLRTARGEATQAAFAMQLGVERSCLSRYESEKLGAPTHVLNECLKIVAKQQQSEQGASSLHRALFHVRQAADMLESAEKESVMKAPRRRRGRS